jgi:hypothetical protein
MSCSKDDDGCAVFDFAAASEQALRSNGSSVAVHCPLHFYTPSPETFLSECKILIEEAVNHIGLRFLGCLNSIEAASIQYGKNQGYVDTFEPGQESADGYTEIVATVPLNWHATKRCKR